MVIRQWLEQRRKNKELEASFDDEDRSTLEYINTRERIPRRGSVTKKTGFFSYEKGPGIISYRNCLPPSTPSPLSRGTANPEYDEGFLKIKTFLEKYPEYRTSQTEWIREAYMESQDL